MCMCSSRVYCLRFVRLSETIFWQQPETKLWAFIMHVYILKPRRLSMIVRAPLFKAVDIFVEKASKKLVTFVIFVGTAGVYETALQWLYHSIVFWKRNNRIPNHVSMRSTFLSEKPAKTRQPSHILTTSWFLQVRTGSPSVYQGRVGAAPLEEEVEEEEEEELGIAETYNDYMPSKCY